MGMRRGLEVHEKLGGGGIFFLTEGKGGRGEGKKNRKSEGGGRSLTLPGQVRTSGATRKKKNLQGYKKRREVGSWRGNRE